MNTRLQVEHPVTEMVTGVDLVQAQLRVAAGEALPWRQEQLQQRGHAIECRIYAEDPASGFLPQAGRLLLYREPSGPGIRVDAGVVEGSEVPVFYDPLLAKLIVAAETRAAAIARALSALRRYIVLGVRTNIPFLIEILRHPCFQAGEIDTNFLDRTAAELLGRPAEPLPDAARAALAFHDAHAVRPGTRLSGTAVADPFETVRGWSVR
jgi:acetyl/propionyl-CoA carboxylase alpha subunit